MKELKIYDDILTILQVKIGKVLIFRLSSSEKVASLFTIFFPSKYRKDFLVFTQPFTLPLGCFVRYKKTGRTVVSSTMTTKTKTRAKE